jgi:hypothetical protein
VELESFAQNLSPIPQIVSRGTKQPFLVQR